MSTEQVGDAEKMRQAADRLERVSIGPGLSNERRLAMMEAKAWLNEAADRLDEERPPVSPTGLRIEVGTECSPETLRNAIDGLRGRLMLETAPADPHQGGDRE